MDIFDWEKIFIQKVEKTAPAKDPAHDFTHFQRVATTAKNLCETEKGSPFIVVPAAWLHDLVHIPKNDPRRSQASKISAQATLAYLREIQYPEEYFEGIAHAIEAHSFSAGIEATTLEAKIVQDADRLDGIGAIGIARCFAMAGVLGRPLYSPHDPFCTSRPPNDGQYTLDHFFVKLFKIVERLQTQAGKEEGARRAAAMKYYLQALSREITEFQ